jgi:hypothetical protein
MSETAAQADTTVMRGAITRIIHYHPLLEGAIMLADIVLVGGIILLFVIFGVTLYKIINNNHGDSLGKVIILAFLWAVGLIVYLVVWWQSYLYLSG